ncbi:MAG: hypothetical protein LUO93_01790 [Methanomicrobiales archaeon]|nr:hypothetical protein [Methanomicrobiales archaeon]
MPHETDRFILIHGGAASPIAGRAKSKSCAHDPQPNTPLDRCPHSIHTIAMPQQTSPPDPVSRRCNFILGITEDAALDRVVRDEAETLKKWGVEPSRSSVVRWLIADADRRIRERKDEEKRARIAKGEPRKGKA